ncbi:MAG: hypothetical protein JOZ32_00005, partial [Bryobacterales bacterium]|nr:hypothetical protein [Bryobacterales bacterium]
MTHSPVMYLDQWSIVQDLQQSKGAVSLPLLWAQHNEHRILIGRLALITDLDLFGGRNDSLFVEIVLVQLCLVGLLTWMCRYFGQFRGAVLVTAIGFFSYCMFCPLQLENFFWGFQIVFVFAELSAALSFACVIWHAGKVADGDSHWMSWPLLFAF